MVLTGHLPWPEKQVSFGQLSGTLSMAKKSVPLIQDVKVFLYLIAVEPAMTGMFKVLDEPVPSVSQLRKRVVEMENSILELQKHLVSSNLMQDPTLVDAYKRLLSDVHRETLRANLEQSVQSGHEGKVIVDASIAAGIIFLAHRCFELAETAMKSNGRKVALHL
jgi:hypothetical protein